MTSIDTVITSYNRKDQVSGAIDSALKAQEVWQGNVIVVDDASTDDSVAFLQEKYGDSITLIIHDENKGVTAAKNAGVVAASGDWAICLDSDDHYVESAMEEAKQKLSAHTDAPVVFFRCRDQAGNFVGSQFAAEQNIDLKRFLKYTSHGEALTAFNKAIVKHPPYEEDLRGYEGLGIARIIEDKGSAVLSTTVLRVYDCSGDDRLSSGKIVIKRALSLAKGHCRLLSRYYKHMEIMQTIRMIMKIIIYGAVGIVIEAKNRVMPQ